MTTITKAKAAEAFFAAQRSGDWQAASVRSPPAGAHRIEAFKVEHKHMFVFRFSPTRKAAETLGNIR